MNVAIVTPWYGEELQGGAERLAFEAAEGLAARGHHVEVLTTCSESFHSDWYANARKPGVTQEHGVTVRRFAVDKADRSRFAEVNARILETPRSRVKPGCVPFDAADMRDFIRHNINSYQLAAYIRNGVADFDAFVFLPYLYGTTLQCWRLVAEKAILIPCLHDEPYAYLPRVTEMMHGVAAIAFNGPATFELARRLYGPAILPKAVITGAAVALRGNGTPVDCIKDFFPQSQKYALYIGRRSPEKNFDLLLRSYRAFREIAPESRLRLVCAGPDRLPEGLPPGVIDVGLVSEDEKIGLLRHAKFLVQPSVNESYSRVLMESWIMGRPALVHADCTAAAAAVHATGGGWTASDMQSWQQAFLWLDSVDDTTLNETALRARGYVDRYSDISGVSDNYERLIERVRDDCLQHALWAGERTVQSPVHVYSPNLRYGTAGATLAFATQAELNAHGIDSHVFAHRADEEFAALVEGDETDLPVGARVLVDASDERRMQDFINMHPDVKAVRIPPIPLPNADRWTIAPDPVLMDALQDGRRNILFVGEIGEHNRQLEMLEIFAHYLTIDFDARLALVGRVVDQRYHHALMERVERTGVSQRILVPGLVSEPALAAFYRTASIYCSVADGAALAVPILEAMQFNVPVCVTRTMAAEAILASSGILVDDAGDRLRLAAVWNVVATDPQTRSAVLASQNTRLRDFSACGAVRQLVESVA